MPGRWILIESQRPQLLAGLGQSLAGLAAGHHLLPLTRNEMAPFLACPGGLDEAVLQGGYPGVAARDVEPGEYLDGCIADFVDRDVVAVRSIGRPDCFRRFLELCAGSTAQPLNCSGLASAAGVSQPTARIWLSVLEAGFIVFCLPAYAGTSRRRLKKAPKLHFYDTGLACRLLGIRDVEQLRVHPLRAAVFETWVVSEAMKRKLHQGLSCGLSHYRERRGTGVDLVVVRDDEAMLVDTQAGQTLVPDTFEAIGRVQSEWAGTGRVRAKVVYGGGSPRDWDGIAVAPWSDGCL